MLGVCWLYVGMGADAGACAGMTVWFAAWPRPRRRRKMGEIRQGEEEP